MVPREHEVTRGGRGRGGGGNEGRWGNTQFLQGLEGEATRPFLTRRLCNFACEEYIRFSSIFFQPFVSFLLSFPRVAFENLHYPPTDLCTFAFVDAAPLCLGSNSADSRPIEVQDSYIPFG